MSMGVEAAVDGSEEEEEVAMLEEVRSHSFIYPNKKPHPHPYSLLNRNRWRIQLLKQLSSVPSAGRASGERCRGDNGLLCSFTFSDTDTGSDTR